MVVNIKNVQLQLDVSHGSNENIELVLQILNQANEVLRTLDGQPQIFVNAIKKDDIEFTGHSNEEIENFLSEFGTEVEEDEDSSYVELMMDNHICIDFEGTQYYVKKESMMYGDFEKSIVEDLKENFSV